MSDVNLVKALLGDTLLDTGLRDYLLDCTRRWVPPDLEIGLPPLTAAPGDCVVVKKEPGAPADVFEVIGDMHNKPMPNKLEGRFAVCTQHKGHDLDATRVPSSASLYGFEYRPDRDLDGWYCQCWERARR